MGGFCRSGSGEGVWAALEGARGGARGSSSSAKLINQSGAHGKRILFCSVDKEGW